MIQSYSLFTSQLDDNEAALQEIQQQLEKITLCKHSVGVMACHNEYVDMGIAEAVVHALPFPVAGLVTFYQATPEVNGLFELTLTVLTSDDVRFALAGRSLAEGADTAESQVQSAYQQACGLEGEAPAFILNLLTMHSPISGDAYLRMLDGASGGVPCFGGVSAGEADDGKDLYVTCGADCYLQGFAMILFFGPVKPTFYFQNFRQDKLLEMRATVTEVQGNVVKKLNGQPAYAFMEKNGVVLDEEAKRGLSTIPFLYKAKGEEEYIARTMGGVNQEDEVLFFGEVPVGAEMRAGVVTSEDIMELSRNAVMQALQENPEASLLLMLSCVGRFITLGLGTTAEMEAVTAGIPQGMPFLACYVGGEICPVFQNGKAANRYHNSSFVVCALQ